MPVRDHSFEIEKIKSVNLFVGPLCIEQDHFLDLTKPKSSAAASVWSRWPRPWDHQVVPDLGLAELLVRLDSTFLKRKYLVHSRRPAEISPAIFSRYSNILSSTDSLGLEFFWLDRFQGELIINPVEYGHLTSTCFSWWRILKPFSE